VDFDADHVAANRCRHRQGLGNDARFKQAQGVGEAPLHFAHVRREQPGDLPCPEVDDRTVRLGKILQPPPSFPFFGQVGTGIE
jgi:hypothetical protein